MRYDIDPVLVPKGHIALCISHPEGIYRRARKGSISPKKPLRDGRTAVFHILRYSFFFVIFPSYPQPSLWQTSVPPRDFLNSVEPQFGQVSAVGTSQVENLQSG